MSKYKDLGYELGLKHVAALKAVEQYFPRPEDYLQDPPKTQQVKRGENLNKLRIKDYGV